MFFCLCSVCIEWVGGSVQRNWGPDMMLSQKSIKIDGYAKIATGKVRNCRAMRRTYVRRSSEAIAATQHLATFCDAI